MERAEVHRILLVHNYYQIPGGEDTVVANEKKLLEERGHEVFLYTRDNGELKRMSKLKKLLLPFTALFSLRTYREICGIIRAKQIDVVHVHNTLALVSPSVYFAAFRRGVPVVQTLHNFRLECPGATFYRDGRVCEDCLAQGLSCAVRHRCYRGSRAQTLMQASILYLYRALGVYRRLNYICLTEFNREKLLLLNRPGRRQVVDPDRVFVKPNFTFENAAPRGEAGYFLFLGRVEALKGLDVLIDAFLGLPGEKLVIAGSGPDFQAYAARASGADNISFAGQLGREEVKAALAAAKAVIAPSQWYEGFPMVVVEAYAAGVPVLGSDLGNIGALIEDGRTGLRFRYDSAEDLRAAVRRFLSADARLWGQNARDLYRARYSPGANGAALEEIYRRAAGSGRGAGRSS